jgi:hypothetical protein
MEDKDAISSEVMTVTGDGAVQPRTSLTLSESRMDIQLPLTDPLLIAM